MGGAPMGGGPRGAVNAGGLDQGAMDLLRSLPPAQQQEILSKLATSNASNPSAWVVKSCLAAGASGGGAGGGGFGGMGGAMYGAQRSGPPARLPPGIEVDQQAQQLLRSLSPMEQQNIVQKLQNSWNEGTVQNP